MKVKTIKKTVAVAFALALVAPLGLGNQASAKDGGSRQINEQPVSKLKQGGTFRFVQVDICPNFNTSAIEGNLLNCSQVMGTMLPSFIYFDKDAKIQVDPNYATSVKASRVGGKQTVTYDLNPNAKWSDGKKIGLADFVGMWNAQKGVDKTYKITSSVGYEKIESVKKGANENQIVVTFKETYADWQPLFSGLKPASLTKDAATFNDSWKNGPTVWAGPFRPATGKGASSFLDKVGRLITVERNPKWWGDKPVLDKVVFKALPQAAQIAALLNGEIDYMDIGNDINALKQARENSKISVRVAKAPTHEHFTFGPPTAVTKEVAVRQAIMLSIDRAAIATAIQGVVDPKVKPNNNHVFLDGTACTQDNTGKLGKRDIAAAQALLTGAGWAKGADGIYAKGGTRLSVKLIYPSNNDNRRDTVLLASAQAKEAGIELVPTLIPTATTSASTCSSATSRWRCSHGWEPTSRSHRSATSSVLVRRRTSATSARPRSTVCSPRRTTSSTRRSAASWPTRPTPRPSSWCTRSRCSSATTWSAFRRMSPTSVHSASRPLTGRRSASPSKQRFTS